MAGIRRTWDKSVYEAKAKDRLERGVEDERQGPGQPVVRSNREEFKRASDGAEGPVGSERAFLKARESRVDLDGKVGKTEVIKPNTVEHAAGPGYFCEICSCLLKDSASYLDHINGKKRKEEGVYFVSDVTYFTCT
jgi:U4/U6.U5 tri-snRNP component SNU23